MRMIRSRRLPIEALQPGGITLGKVALHRWGSGHRLLPRRFCHAQPQLTRLHFAETLDCEQVGHASPGAARNDRFQLLVRQHLRAHHDRIDNQRRRPTVIGAAGPCHSSTARERSNKYRCRGACIDGYGCRHSHSFEERRAVAVKVSAPRRRGLCGVQRIYCRHGIVPGIHILGARGNAWIAGPNR
jgi:hypothetical protein